jgi:hypothetical protein
MRPAYKMRPAYHKRPSFTVTILGYTVGSIVGFSLALYLAVPLFQALKFSQSVSEATMLVCAGVGAVTVRVLWVRGPKMWHYDLYEYLEPCRRCRDVTWHAIRVYDGGIEIYECEKCHKITKKGTFAIF